MKDIRNTNEYVMNKKDNKIKFNEQQHQVH